MEMSWFYHSPAQKTNFIQNEYVTVFKWVHLHPRHAKYILFKHSFFFHSTQFFSKIITVRMSKVPVKKVFKVKILLKITTEGAVNSIKLIQFRQFAFQTAALLLGVL